MCVGVEKVRVLNATNTPWQGTYRRTTFHMVGLRCSSNNSFLVMVRWFVAVVAEHYYLHLSSRNYYYYYMVEKSSKEKFFYILEMESHAMLLFRKLPHNHPKPRYVCLLPQR